MITSYNNRTINYNKPVKVYRNLRGKNYSIMQGGKVVAHASKIVLKDCIFKINKAGQLRTRKTKQKNVHAFVVGYMSNATLKYEVIVTYNPFTMDYFVDHSRQPITKADFVSIGNEGVFAKGITNGRPTQSDRNS